MKKKKMNHQLKEEEGQKTKIDVTIFKSLGVYVIEQEINIIKSNNKKNKIKNILNKII